MKLVTKATGTADSGVCILSTKSEDTSSWICAEIMQIKAVE